MGDGNPTRMSILRLKNGMVAPKQRMGKPQKGGFSNGKQFLQVEMG